MASKVEKEVVGIRNEVGDRIKWTLRTKVVNPKWLGQRLGKRRHA